MAIPMKLLMIFALSSLFIISAAFAISDSSFIVAHKKATLTKLDSGAEHVSVSIDICNRGSASTCIRGAPKFLISGDFVGPWQGPSNENKRGLRDVESEDSSIECDCVDLCLCGNLGIPRLQLNVEMQASTEQSSKQHQTPNAWNTPTRVLIDLEQWPKLAIVSPLAANEMIMTNKLGSPSVDQRREVIGTKQHKSVENVQACRNEDLVELHMEDTQSGKGECLDGDTTAISGKSLQAWSSLLKEEINKLSKMKYKIGAHKIENLVDEGLGYIASIMGTPLYLDEPTFKRSRLTFARICVEVPANKEVPESFKINLGYGDPYGIQVEVPWKPQRCDTLNPPSSKQEWRVKETNIQVPTKWELVKKKGRDDGQGSTTVINKEGETQHFTPSTSNTFDVLESCDMGELGNGELNQELLCQTKSLKSRGSPSPNAAYDVNFTDNSWAQEVFELVGGNTTKTWERLDAESHVLWHPCCHHIPNPMKSKLQKLELRFFAEYGSLISVICIVGDNRWCLKAMKPIPACPGEKLDFPGKAGFSGTARIYGRMGRRN
ncbi:unnamed protein product [Camellia sinensis]